MKTKKMAPILLLAMVTLLTGCFGGGGSTPISRGEIDAFFALYAHRAETQNVDALLGMYQVPVTFTEEEISLRIVADEPGALSHILRGRLYLFDDDEYDYGLDVKTFVESVSGNSSSAIAEVILVREVDDGWGKQVDNYKIRFSLQKSSGKWRIRAEHFLHADGEYIEGKSASPSVCQTAPKNSFIGG